MVLQNLHTPPAAPQTSGDEQTGAVENGDMSATNGIPKDDSKLNMMRETEILSKAVAAVFILLLKWFKVSRKSSSHIDVHVMLILLDVLKFEYMTQLLLDTSYLPLMLRIFSHVDVGTYINMKTDRLEYSYVLPQFLHE